jgi:hypothetical protein
MLFLLITNQYCLEHLLSSAPPSAITVLWRNNCGIHHYIAALSLLVYVIIFSLYTCLYLLSPCVCSVKRGALHTTELLPLSRELDTWKLSQISRIPISLPMCIYGHSLHHRDDGRCWPERRPGSTVVIWIRMYICVQKLYACNNSWE